MMYYYYKILYERILLLQAVTAYGSLQDPSILKERRRLAESDVALRYLGYWTNNGKFRQNLFN